VAWYFVSLVCLALSLHDFFGQYPEESKGRWVWQIQTDWTYLVNDLFLSQSTRLWSVLSCVFIVGKNVVSFEHIVVNTVLCNESVGLVVRMKPDTTDATRPPGLYSTDLWPCRLGISEGSTEMLTLKTGVTSVSLTLTMLVVSTADRMTGTMDTCNKAA